MGPRPSAPNHTNPRRDRRERIAERNTRPCLPDLWTDAASQSRTACSRARQHEVASGALPQGNVDDTERPSAVRQTSTAQNPPDPTGRDYIKARQDRPSRDAPDAVRTLGFDRLSWDSCPRPSNGRRLRHRGHGTPRTSDHWRRGSALANCTRGRRGRRIRPARDDRWSGRPHAQQNPGRRCRSLSDDRGLTDDGDLSSGRLSADGRASRHQARR